MRTTASTNPAVATARPTVTAGAAHNARTLDAAALAAWPLPVPDADADKDARGSLLVIAGGREMPGAAILAATAALRAGGGKLKIATAASVAQAVAVAVPEARVVAWEEGRHGGPVAGTAKALAVLAERCDAVLIGPGMQGNAAVRRLVRALLPKLAERGTALVLDACAMDAVASVTRFTSPVVLTPHAGEMAHLSGLSKEAVTADAPGVALHYAAAWGATVLLKGATTWLATPAGELWCHQGGSVGLATSGSGDTLAGMVCGLVASGASPAQAAAWGCVLHAQAGGRLAERLGPLGYLARELPAELPGLLRALSGQP